MLVKQHTKLSVCNTISSATLYEGTGVYREQDLANVESANLRTVGERVAAVKWDRPR